MFYKRTITLIYLSFKMCGCIFNSPFTWKINLYILKHKLDNTVFDFRNVILWRLCKWPSVGFFIMHKSWAELGVCSHPDDPYAIKTSILSFVFEFSDKLSLQVVYTCSRSVLQITLAFTLCWTLLWEKKNRQLWICLSDIH